MLVELEPVHGAAAEARHLRHDAEGEPPGGADVGHHRPDEDGSPDEARPRLPDGVEARFDAEVKARAHRVLGSADGFDSGAPVSVHVPADALRVLGAEAPPEVDPEAAAPDEDAAAAEPSQAAGKP